MAGFTYAMDGRKPLKKPKILVSVIWYFLTHETRMDGGKWHILLQVAMLQKDGPQGTEQLVGG